MKRELHTLYIKHNGEFKTLSKIALAQLILKIVHIKGDGALYKQIESELSSVLSSSVAKRDVEDAIRVLVNERKLNVKSGRHFIHNDYRIELSQEVDASKKLLASVLKKYFGKAESAAQDIEDWFNDTTIAFFERFSFDWFYQVTYKGKNGSNTVPNIHEILDSVFLQNTKILEADKTWLKSQYAKFVESEDANDNLLFWYYGISMFSSRLITARNYADGITIELFRDSKFVLDTNILMILDLEEHELSNSLRSLENILIALNITPVYFHATREEYLRAMNWRKTETIRVFDNFELKVLKSSDCPFIQTALRRGCTTGEDVERMFDDLLDIPKVFNEQLALKEYDYNELAEAINLSKENEELRRNVNDTYKSRTKNDKRDNPLTHDAGIIGGAHFLRESGEKCWIITSDSTVKRYALDYCLRDENEIAVGLDVVIGLMAVNNGGADVDASNFAPLFKNLIKYSLIPESDAFEVKDLAFILRTNIKANELPDERVIEVAKEVKRLRIGGEEDEKIALYLRRVMEEDTVGMVKDMREAQVKESIAQTKREQAEKERDVAYDEIRSRRKGELRDEYDAELLYNRLKILLIPSTVLAIVFITIRIGLGTGNNIIDYAVGCSVELIFGILPMIPLNNRFVRKHSEYVIGIDKIVENEIHGMKNKGKL